ncbi:hypothetical protein [Arsenicibacter rosenii]|uniref:Uncharacterized protein n=1 Tax=Arsenicibacter rosenii TaxID=1750698 RepID=A0A1S2VML6_9BACT|nr:hypothetical protein [Arsenicibacter rosenii]OIN60011.1 hypothetical protein BLX24_08600 [Arsenicibacter rosenii]
MTPDLSALYQQLPIWLAAGFVGVTVFALAFFYYLLHTTSPRKAIWFTGLATGWLALTGSLAANEFFLNLATIPPRIMLVVVPVFASLITLTLTQAGKRFLDTLPLRPLTYFHLIRIPVELVLFGLFLHRQIPLMMTFEGLNPDILSGITAPVIGWLVFRKQLPTRVLLIWHLLALLLLINIVTIALLSAPTFLQQLNFEQPNVGILKFPFVWLPGFVVPMVALCHLAAIRQLTRRYPTHSPSIR